jgi:sorbitol-specific phosphotransferase system component IIC
MARQEKFIKWVRSVRQATTIEIYLFVGTAGGVTTAALAISSLHLLHSMIGILELCFAKLGKTG